MLSHQLLQDAGILIVKPQGPLEASDFERLAGEIDPYIEKNGRLHGILVEAKSFPGWSDFGALISHLRFVREHHKAIAKVAAVSDSAFLTIAPHIGSHFVKAKVRHFDSKDRDKALAWLKQETP